MSDIVFKVTDVEKQTARRVCEECGSYADGYHYTIKDGRAEITMLLEKDTVLMRHKMDCETGKFDAEYLGCKPK